MMNRSGDNTELLWGMLEDMARDDPLVHAHFTAYRINTGRTGIAIIDRRDGPAATEMLLSLAHAALKERKRLQDLVIDTASLMPRPMILCRHCADEIQLATPKAPTDGNG